MDRAHCSCHCPRLQHYQPLRIVDEIRNKLHKEIDFRREARNIKQFAVAFKNWDTIHIPGAIDDLVSENVVVQERSGCYRIDDPAVAAEGPRLARNFVDAYLHQIFVLGLFRGNPHPGNLFITQEGRICLHDFGLVGVFDNAMRGKLASFTNAFMRQDANGEGLTSRACTDQDQRSNMLARSIHRLALAIVVLGLYISAALLLQSSAGPRMYGDIPVLAAISFALALWITLRLARNASRSEDP